MDEMTDEEAEVRAVLNGVIIELEKHDANDGEHFQRVQEFNSVVYWLTKVCDEGLPEAIEEFSKEVEGVLI